MQLKIKQNNRAESKTSAFFSYPEIDLRDWVYRIKEGVNERYSKDLSGFDKMGKVVLANPFGENSRS